MRRTFVIIRAFFYIFLLCGGFWVFYHFNTNRLYIEYSNLWNYRRLHPELQNNERTVRIIDAGHTTTYADFMWINLIQYIADNLRNHQFITFTTPILDTISQLHPYFTKSYTLALLLAPSVESENPSAEKNREVSQHALEMAKRGIQKTCNQEKQEKIQSGWIAGMPWENEELKNPCIDGYIPYYAAYVADMLGDRKQSYEYYALASANEDAPQAARFLALLIQGKWGNRIEAAMQFLLVASAGYDESPFRCHEAAIEWLSLLRKDSLIDPTILDWAKQAEKNIQEPKDKDNPLATSSTNCFDSTNRAIKQIYLQYITEHTKDYPEITTGKILLERWILSSIPMPLSYSGFTVRRESDGRWEYRME